MTQAEIDDVLDNIEYLDRTSWEQTRLLATIQANCFAKKPLDSTDIMRFKWDKQVKEQKQGMSNTDLERLKKKAKLIQEQWQAASHSRTRRT